MAIAILILGVPRDPCGQMADTCACTQRYACYSQSPHRRVKPHMTVGWGQILAILLILGEPFSLGTARLHYPWGNGEGLDPGRGRG